MTTNTDKTSIADLVAKYGSSSATAWLEFDRYKLWRPTEPVPESSFTPVQGYMERDSYIFAWGNPLVSDKAALLNVARQFIHWCDSQGMYPVWCCVDSDLEETLASEEFNWSTVACVYEDVVDPAHIIDLTSPGSKGAEGQKVVKDLKKNLNRAEKYSVQVREMSANDWTEEDKTAVENGIRKWKASKHGVQIAATSGQPWLDSVHRRYWVAKKDVDIVGILILTPIQGACWQIKNAISFPSAPKGTSEALIYTALKDLHLEEEAALRRGDKIPHPVNNNFTGAHITSVATNESSFTSPSSSSLSSGISFSSHPSCGPEQSESSTTLSTESTADANSVDSTPRSANEEGPSLTTPSFHGRDRDRVAVTFGLSAAAELEPVHNLGGWKISALSKTYGKVVKGAKLVQRGEFRSKFDSSHEAMYVCYPNDGFGLEGVNALLKVLRK